jgi:uncharacterized membrane protein YfcA
MHPAQYATLAAVGLVAGGVNAIAGGGTLLMFPALVATGMPTVDASVTNSVALFAIAGSLCGSALLLTTPKHVVSLIVPFLVFAASLVLAAQPWLKKRFGASADHDRNGLISACVFGVGIYGGFFQGALGVILMAVLGVAMVATLTVVNALKGLLQVVIVSANVVVFSLFGPVHWLAALFIAPASLLGGVLGGRFARSVNELVLRRCVVVFGLVVAVWLAVRALR